MVTPLYGIGNVGRVELHSFLVTLSWHRNAVQPAKSCIFGPCEQALLLRVRARQFQVSLGVPHSPPKSAFDVYTCATCQAKPNHPLSQRNGVMLSEVNLCHARKNREASDIATWWFPRSAARNLSMAVGFTSVFDATASAALNFVHGLRPKTQLLQHLLQAEFLLLE